MGVNAVMFGLVPAEHTSPLYLRKQNIDIVDAFPNLFEDGEEPIQLPSESISDIGDHDLSFSLSKTRRIIIIEYLPRYYGGTCLSGPLPLYIALAEWLERRFPGIEILYGSDTGHIAQDFSAASRRRAMDRFTAIGHQTQRQWDEIAEMAPKTEEGGGKEPK